MFIKNVRLGKDAETAVTKGGKPMLKLACAYDSGWGDNKKTVWINAVKWGDKNDGILPYLKKGAVIEIACDDVFPEAYTAKDGTLKASLTANVIRIGLIPQPSQQNQGQAQRTPAQQHSGTSQPVRSVPVSQLASQPQTAHHPASLDFDDDIPF